MLVNLRDFLKTLLAKNGIEILDREPEDFIWARYQDGLELIYVEEEEIVSGDYIINFARKTELIKANKTLICVKGCTDDAKNMANRMNIELLDRGDFAHLIGEFVLEIYEKSKEIPMEILQEEDIEVEEVEEESQDVIPIFLEEVSEEGEERIIKLSISEDEASAIAKGYVHGFNQKLILLPYLVFEYSLEILVEGKIETKQVKGVIAINGLNKKYEIWRRGYETTVHMDLPHQRLEPTLGLEDCKKIAADALSEEYSKEEEVKIEGENITIIEKRKTKPKKGTIKLNFLGLYYLPVWVAEGRDGMIMINGASGEIMKESTYRFTT